MKKETTLFERATRYGYRFPFRGLINVEDLWMLSVESLDSVYKTLNAEVKKSQEESLLASKSAEDTILADKIDIVKHIVSVKLEERAAREEEHSKKAKKQKILEIMAEKQDADLHNASMDELKKMLDELGE